MPKNLVIVESPAKAKTIEGYLGNDYQVASSYGHVRDLPKGNGAIDIDNGYLPQYVITDDKKEVVRQLKKMAKEAETIWLATDDDREGEAISWHLKEALELGEETTRRIVFREITKNAILNAIQAPRQIDDDLVNAQKARRVLDRLVGFELSPVLWKKVKAGLSAGRVQSVAARLVVEREREIKDFKPDTFYRVRGDFLLEGGKKLKAELKHYLNTLEEARQFLQNCQGSEFSIEKLETKPGKKSPSAPFTTSTLQQEASKKIGFSVAKTMQLAQRLYEAGHITYMRTDSVNLSQEARNSAKNAILKEYGQEYHQNRAFKTKSQGAQEAHEAIRPVDFSKPRQGKDADEKKLYELVWKRAIASQMADAKLERTTATIGVSGDERKFVAKGEVVTFEGFLKVYIAASDEEEDSEKASSGILPPLDEGQVLSLEEINATQRFTRPAARYNEATLVKKLEQLGIGRPSTYAPTISTIQKRNYVIKDSRDGVPRNFQQLVLREGQIEEETLTENTGVEKNKLFPTDIGIVVNDFLVEHFPSIVDYSFTATVEKEFDEIAQGQIQWQKMIDQFYKAFHPLVEQTENAERASKNTVRELGTDPETGKPVIVRLGRYGPLAQIGEANEETGEKPRFASLRKGQLLETITLEEALKLFELPRDVGTFEDKKVVASIGRFGPYVRHDGKFASIPKDKDPYTIKEDEAIELIKAKRQRDAERTIRKFEDENDTQILKGRWGPYIKQGKTNARIPKEIEKPEELSLDEAQKIIADAEEKKAQKAGKTTKKTAAKSSTSTTPAKKSSATKKSSSKKSSTSKAKSSTSKTQSGSSKKNTGGE